MLMYNRGVLVYYIMSYPIILHHIILYQGHVFSFGKIMVEIVTNIATEFLLFIAAQFDENKLFSFFNYEQL